MIELSILLLLVASFHAALSTHEMLPSIFCSRARFPVLQNVDFEALSRYHALLASDEQSPV